MASKCPEPGQTEPRVESAPPPRSARLVLVKPDGTVLGVLPPFPVSTPWWQDAEPVVRAARVNHGIEVTLLRLLDTEMSQPQGGGVTYLAETDGYIGPIEPWHGGLPEHLLRLPCAKPGGPKADRDWAFYTLRGQGIEPSGAPVQMRTWNLSSIWKIPTAGQTVWLKSVPPFFAHEGRLLMALAGEPVPQVLAHDETRFLLAEIAGEDMHEPSPGQRLAMVTLLTSIQAAWKDRVDSLLALGLPDWRAAALAAAIENVVVRTAAELPFEDRRLLEAFARGLAQRFADCAACGIGDSLVHGDFHPGNFRGDDDKLTLLDWADSGVGHPLLDQPAFFEHAPRDNHPDVTAHWNRQILAAWPGSDPARAAQLLAPIAAARQAVIYRKFLDNIEPSEQVYHRTDPATWLSRAAQILRDE
jgi:Phosphotransferase enzyme family